MEKTQRRRLSARVLYGQPVAMMKFFDGIHASTHHGLLQEPQDEYLFAIVNRRIIQIKVLYFDRSGRCL